MVVHPDGSGRAQTDKVMDSDTLFANFLIIIHEKKINEGVLQLSAHVQKVRYLYTKLMFPFGLKYISLKFHFK